jgi:type II secretory pathway component PulK
VLGDSVRVGSILDWIDGDDVARAAGAESEWYLARGRKPPRNAGLAHARELVLVRGFEGLDARTLEALFTARGDGRVSPNRASARVLRSISLLTPEDAERLVELRAARRPFRDAEDVDLALGLDLDVDGFRELTNRLSFAGPGRTMRVVGRSRGARGPITAELIATVVPANDRLAVVGMEVW